MRARLLLFAVLIHQLTHKNVKIREMVDNEDIIKRQLNIRLPNLIYLQNNRRFCEREKIGIFHLKVWLIIEDLWSR